MALLETRSVSVRFGGNLALSEVDLAAEASSITGLIGPNGAGKTTLFNVITGLQAPTRGRILVDTEDITKLAPFKRARRGMARTFQRLELFGLLTVRENLTVAADIRRGWSRAHPVGLEPVSESPAETAERLIGEVGLGEVADVRADSLPTGLARLVELGRALATRPRLLLLDEPASGQDETETARFAAVLRRLSHEGMAVVLVEHDVRLVMEVCDTIHVLDFGKILAVGTPADIRDNEAVLAAYLGSGPLATRRRG